MFTPTPATDGYGDRQDIADARDFSDKTRIAEAKQREQLELETAIALAKELLAWAELA